MLTRRCVSSAPSRTGVSRRRDREQAISSRLPAAPDLHHFTLVAAELDPAFPLLLLLAQITRRRFLAARRHQSPLIHTYATALSDSQPNLICIPKFPQQKKRHCCVDNHVWKISFASRKNPAFYFVIYSINSKIYSVLCGACTWLREKRAVKSNINSFFQSASVHL
jgi:hypothetical protein